MRSPLKLTEVKEAISKLKDEKEVFFFISAELLNSGGRLHASWLQSGTIPPDLLKVVVIPLWKGKGNHMECSNHPGIKLLTIPGYVLVLFLL